MSQSLFSQPLNVINVGIAMFSDDLKKQHVEVTQLDWTPPGQGNMQVVQALDNIADSPLADKITAANQQALERIIQSHPVLIGFDQAINVVPGMTPVRSSKGWVLSSSAHSCTAISTPPVVMTLCACPSAVKYAMVPAANRAANMANADRINTLRFIVFAPFRFFLFHFLIYTAFQAIG